MLNSMSICLTEHAQKRIQILPFVPDESRPKFACCCPRVQLVLEGPVAYSEGLFSCGWEKLGMLVGRTWGSDESVLLTERWARSTQAGVICVCVCAHLLCMCSRAHVCVCTSMCACVCREADWAEEASREASIISVALSVEAGQ